MENLVARSVPTDQQLSLSELIKGQAKKYLKQHTNGDCDDVYKAILCDLEIPLLETVMRFTRNNQSEAARILGLSRGTLRKKLKQYFGACYIAYE